MVETSMEIVLSKFNIGVKELLKICRKEMEKFMRAYDSFLHHISNTRSVDILSSPTIRLDGPTVT